MQQGQQELLKPARLQQLACELGQSVLMFEASNARILA